MAIAPNLSSQCKYERNEQDQFTGSFVRESKPASILKKFSPPNYIDLSLIQNGDEYAIKLIWHGEPISEGTMIQPGDYLALKLSDGSVINASTKSESAAALNKAISVVYLESTYSVGQEDFKLLASKNITAIRITSGGKEYDYEIKFNAARKLMEAAMCMLRE